ncbi:MAG: UDP-N-acetylmuramoyl-tripeptide--D-alanyl-D-alanine ligase [Kiritimatiellia bacterium]|jgi:UDP-N-acetylmuramoyl-tripeptide--D-alanyl-D-alanine ligase
MISALSLQYLRSHFGGEVINENVEFTSVSINTRDINSGDCFVALKGDRFDAHEFLAAAVNAGVCAVVVDHAVDEISIPQWVVDDTTIALGHIAHAQRENFTGQLFAITGSSGKTTVKGMLLSILQLAVGGAVFATQGNLNNHIGVPLTLLSLMKHHQYAVIEMGASALGEIDYLTRLADPDVALINNVMPAHIEGFGSMDNIATAKGEIYNGLSGNGVAIVNLDDHYAGQWLLQNSQRKVITFSKTEVADESDRASVRATAVETGADGCASFQLHFQGEQFPVRLQVLGLHNVSNALAAAACAYAANISVASVVQGLQNFIGIDGRLQRLVGFKDAVVMDDSYNANPSSMRAAIDVLADASARKIFIMGDMAELGESSLQEHQDVGVYAKDKSIDVLLAVGTYSKAAVYGFSKNAIHYDNVEQLIIDAKKMADENTVFLIKGSRSSRMDIVVQALIQRGDNNASLAC